MSEGQKNRSETTAVSNAVRHVNNEDTHIEIDLVELAYRLLEKWKFIVCLTLIGAILVGAYTVFLVTPMYEATSIIYVLNRSDSAINVADLQIGTALTSDYIKVFSMWEVHEEVISNLSLPYTYNQIQRMLTIVNDDNTRMLDITFTSPDPEEAANVANEYAKVVSRYIADTMKTDAPSMMSVARVPVNPARPSKFRNILIGGMLGCLAACGYVFIVFIKDDKYKTSEDIKKYTGLITLATIPISDSDVKKSKRRSQ